MKASIVVPIYRAEATLGRCLRSLIDQDATFPFEILAVDNGSDDGSLRLLETLAPRSDGRLRVLQESEPGSYAARNRGLAAARGEVVAFTDADCRAETGWLRVLVGALEDPSLALVGGSVLGEPAQPGLVPSYSRRVKILDQQRALRHPLGPFLQTANLAVRTAEARAVGGFDATLYSGGDADFCWRLLSAGRGEIRWVESAAVFHAHREDVAGLFRQFRRYGQADVGLARRYGVRRAHALGRFGLDALRLVSLPLIGVIAAIAGGVARDPVRAASPWLKAVRVVARRWGQWEVWRRPSRLRRS